MVPENKDIKRHKKRIQLRFGVEEPTIIGFTEDVSREGLFIKTAHVFPPNTRIKIDLVTSDNNVVNIEGVVKWVHRVPPNFIHLIKKSGMGVMITRIVSGQDTYSRLIS
ncbi:MAG TPA: PilZ domain-containing protein [Thermodesulfobacteriota bacterium]|nr:PilZ domain-containing protein [Thermodesulfobacteriota bacterium]